MPTPPISRLLNPTALPCPNRDSSTAPGRPKPFVRPMTARGRYHLATSCRAPRTAPRRSPASVPIRRGDNSSYEDRSRPWLRHDHCRRGELRAHRRPAWPRRRSRQRRRRPPPPRKPLSRCRSCADHATSSALPWRPEAQGLPRPLTPTDVPAYLEQTPILQLGIREGLLDRRLAITYHPDTAIIAAELRLRPDPRQREFAQLLAHSIVALVQALELPIRAIQLKITDAAGRPQLTAHIGLDTARTRPPATWEPTAAGTRAFLVWAAEGRAATALAERVTLTQAWAQ